MAHVLPPLKGHEDLLTKSMRSSEGPAPRLSPPLSPAHLVSLLHHGVPAEAQRLLLPPGLLEDVASAVWRMGEGELRGFRGCVLNIVLCPSSPTSPSAPSTPSSTPLLTIRNNTVITHEITILLYPDTESWLSKMARIFKPRYTAISPNFSSEVFRLCPDDV